MSLLTTILAGILIGLLILSGLSLLEYLWKPICVVLGCMIIGGALSETFPVMTTLGWQLLLLMIAGLLAGGILEYRARRASVGASALQASVGSPTRPSQLWRKSRSVHVAVLLGAGVVAFMLGPIVAYLAIGLLALTASDCFKNKEYRNGSEAVLLAFLLVVVH